MKIVVVGNSLTGEMLINELTKQKHNVTIIDLNYDKVNEATDKYDVQGIVGNGACRSTQIKAGVQNANIIIAVTNSDEINIMCCIIAKKIGVKSTIAKVSNAEYINEIKFLNNELGVDVVVNPEKNTAHTITRMIQFPELIKIEAFSNGYVDLAEISLEKGHCISGIKLKDLHKKFGTNVLICAVNRNGEVIIPKGDFAIHEGDKLSIIASHAELAEFFKKIGISRPIKSALIVGGGKISYYLASHLAKMGVQTKIIERNKKRCIEFMEKIQNATIICGNGTDSELLVEEGLLKSDACISLTGEDEANLVISLFAKFHHVSKIITEISNTSFSKMLNDVKIEDIVSMHYITVQEISRYVRGIENNLAEADGKNSIITLNEIIDNKVRAIEFKVGQDFKYAGIELMSEKIKIKSNVLIASIIRGDTVIHPSGNSTIEKGDGVIIITTDRKIKNLDDIIVG